MQTELIRVADGVALATDMWWPDAAATAGMDVPRASRVPFLLVHGLASNARMWDGVAERLVAVGHPVATVDLRGHGRSSKPDGPYDVPTVADDVVALASELAIRDPAWHHPIVAGQSWGGNVVLEMAARHPDLASGIVCVDGGWLELRAVFPDWEACREALSPPRLVGRPLAEMEARMRSHHADWPESGIRGALANFEVRPDGTIAPWLTFDRHIVVLRGLWEHHPTERYANVAVPTLLAPVAGRDPGRHAQQQRFVAAAVAAIPNARAHWFVGDHDIHAQHPDELAAAMRAFAGEMEGVVR